MLKCMEPNCLGHLTEFLSHLQTAILRNFSESASDSPVMFLLLSAKSCHSYLERHHGNRGNEVGGEERRGQRREGRGREGGAIQTNNKWSNMCKYKEQNSDGIAITVTTLLQPGWSGRFIFSTPPLVLKKACENRRRGQVYMLLPSAVTLCGMSDFGWGHSLVQQ